MTKYLTPDWRLVLRKAWRVKLALLATLVLPADPVKAQDGDESPVITIAPGQTAVLTCEDPAGCVAFSRQALLQLLRQHAERAAQSCRRGAST